MEPSSTTVTASRGQALMQMGLSHLRQAMAMSKVGSMRTWRMRDFDQLTVFSL